MSTPGTEVATAEAAEQTRLQRNIVVGGTPRHSLAELMELARIMAVAGLVPDALKGKPADILIIAMKGQDLGLSPTQAIDSIHAIKGKPTVGVHLAVSLARKAGHKVRVVEETTQTCTVEIVRCDDLSPVSVTFTVADAKRAQIRNDKYETDPQSMLYARAATRCVRRACPEVLLGFFVEGEVEEAAPARPTLAQVAAERTDQTAPKPAKPAVVDQVQDAEVVDGDDSAAMLAELAELDREHTVAPDLFAGDES